MTCRWADWQVLGFRAESVKQPRAHAGAAFKDRPGVHECVGRVVVDLLGDHRADHADVVGDGADVREEHGDFDAGLAIALELGEGAARDEFASLELGELLAGGERSRERLAVDGVELRLGVEGFELRGTTRHAKVNDPLRPRGEV